MNLEQIKVLIHLLEDLYQPLVALKLYHQLMLQINQMLDHLLIKILKQIQQQFLHLNQIMELYMLQLYQNLLELHLMYNLQLELLKDLRNHHMKNLLIMEYHLPIYQQLVHLLNHDKHLNQQLLHQLG